MHAVFNAPKPPPERVSLGVNALNDCCSVFVMATGAGKHDAVQRWRDGVDLPVTRIHGRCGTDVFLDPPAAGERAVD